MPIDLDKYVGSSEGQYPSFLTAKDVGKKLQVKVKEVREAVIRGDNILVADVEIRKGEIRTMRLNKTNIGAMVELFGKNIEKAVGKTMTLITTPVRNPSTGQMTKGIRIQL